MLQLRKSVSGGIKDSQKMKTSFFDCFYVMPPLKNGGHYSVYLEIKRLAEWIIETFPRKKQLRKDTGAHAWRIAILRYLESKEYIRLFRDGRDLH